MLYNEGPVPTGTGSLNENILEHLGVRRGGTWRGGFYLMPHDYGGFAV